VQAGGLRARTEDLDGFLADFSGDGRSVADYLTGEILAGLSADTRTFLRAVSVCSLLPGAGRRAALARSFHRV
jgi:LuxR family transcriptional regulator, maltose regulon positive regulatory protein